MAVTANQLIQAQNAGARVNLPVDASQRLYQGTMAFHNRTSGASEGYGTAVINGGANSFAGIVVKDANNSSGSAGDLNAEVHQEGAFVLTGVGLTRNLVGEAAYATDNYVITATSGSMTLIGRFVEYISSTRMRVKIDVQQTA